MPIPGIQLDLHILHSSFSVLLIDSPYSGSKVSYRVFVSRNKEYRKILGNIRDSLFRQFSELSGGEAQRLMLVRAVCSRPDMLLVDEPTAQLDTRTAHSVSHVLGNLAGQGMIVLVATHDPDTRDACGRVIDLADYAPGDNEDSSFAPAGGNEPAEPTDSAPAGGGSREAGGGGPTDSTDIAENGSERNVLK